MNAVKIRLGKRSQTQCAYLKQITFFGTALVISEADLLLSLLFLVTRVGMMLFWCN